MSATLLNPNPTAAPSTAPASAPLETPAPATCSKRPAVSSKPPWTRLQLTVLAGIASTFIGVLILVAAVGMF